MRTVIFRLAALVRRYAGLARELVKETAGYLIPSDTGWKGAAWGIIIIISLKILVAAVFQINSVPVYVIGLFVLKYVLQGMLAVLVLTFAFLAYRFMPGFFSWILVAAVVILLDFWGLSNKGKALVIGVAILSASFAGGGLWSIWQHWRTSAWLNRITNLLLVAAGLTGIIYGSVFVLREGTPAEAPVNAARETSFIPEHISLEDPSAPGQYAVLTMTYGSGKDKHRPEYGEEVVITTEPVDGSRFVSNWSKLHGKIRTAYWGFDEETLPLNARVWYPGGDGPFPLVLIVHGNHSDHDYSDPGYEYLGRLTASRGFIFASVDENFINGSWANVFDGLHEENDCRGWLLLKHLELWEEWNMQRGNMFYGLVDMERIALVGHSRGGEAVAVAACFNKLPYYPDDATVAFDFEFGIRSVIAIAPVDGQYMPAGTSTPVHDVNYLTIHGSNDMDMQSFHGARQYQRVTFSGNDYRLKAGLYVFGANHGQFNSTWGRNDAGYPRIAMYNRKQIMPVEDQQKIAEVFISAFLEATLKDRQEYIHLFRDYRHGINWLPETIYLNQFQDTRCRYICTYQEDINLSTTTRTGGHLAMEHLTVWKERGVGMKWGLMDTRAAYLGWNQEEKDSLTASYTIRQDPVNPLITDSGDCLFFMMADANEDSNPHPADIDEEENGHEAEKQNDGNGRREAGEEEQEDGQSRPPIDMSLEICDHAGECASILLSEYAPLQAKIEIQLMKADVLHEGSESENVFHTYTIPLSMFVAGNNQLDVTQISTIRFIFDQTGDGVIILDNIGFWDPVQPEAEKTVFTEE